MPAELSGVKELLAELKNLDPLLRKETVAEIKAPAKVIVATAKGLVPTHRPTRRWVGGTRTAGKFPRWDSGKAKAGIGLKFGGRVNRQSKEWPLVSIVQKDPGGVVFDMAGKKGGNGTRQSQVFLKNLRMYGKPSRTVWPAVERHNPDVTAAITRAVRNAEKELYRRTAGGR
jgi:hypothetical protein